VVEIPSLWRGLIRNTVIVQQDGIDVGQLLENAWKIITAHYDGNPANFTGVMVFVCSLNGIKSDRRGREFGPGGHWALPFRN
jgi:hypothetical protein